MIYRISLYDLLSLLLPGALFTLFLTVLMEDVDIGFESGGYSNSEFLQLTLFLSSAFIIGSFIDMVTRKSLGQFKSIGLYKDVYKIYKEISASTPLEKYYSNLAGFDDNESNNHNKMEILWSEIYYELEAKNTIEVPKTSQSYYFFFRNFITLGVLVSIICLIMLFFSPQKYICIFFLSIITMVLCGFNARWSRRRMVDRVFWTYYALNKNKTSIKCKNQE